MRFIFIFGLLVSMQSSGQSAIDSLKKELYRNDDPKILADLYIRLSTEYRQSNTDSSLFYAQRGYAIISEHSFEHMITPALNAISTAYSFKGMYDTSVQINFKAITHGKSQVDKLPLIKTYNSLAIDYYYMGDLLASGNYFQRSYELAKKEGHLLEEANALQNIGLVKGVQGDVDQEISNYLKARVVFEELGFDEGVANIDMNLGTAYVPLKKYDSGLYYFMSAKQIFGKLDQDAALCVIHTNLAETYLLMGYLTQAKEEALESIRISQNLDLKNEEKYITEVLSRIYEKEGNYKKAYETTVRYQALKDTLFDQEKSAQIEKLKVEFETEQKESEIELLNTENELKDQKINNQNTVIIGSTVSGVLGLSLFVVFFSRYKLKNELSKQLGEKNEVISKSLTEKEMLLKEIHHRVKNNLQIIESLLSLQESSSGGKNPEELLRVSQDRIHAIATIHEKLYQSENLRAIDLKTYIDELIEHFADAYESDQIHFSTEVATINLDLDQLIPCGLIINELITNSLKYAFVDSSKGTISVKGERQAENYLLEISDDGVGFTDQQSGGSLGLRLVNSLVDQLDGQIKKLGGKGTRYQLSFHI